MTVYDKTSGIKQGQTFTDEQKVIVVHDGSRGPQGVPGPEGPAGDEGASIVIRGQWVQGAEYCPGDAVSWRSTANAGVQSLYIQNDIMPCSPAAVEPHLALARWQEIGATDISNITGAIWTIYQIDHQFEWVGTPVAFSYQTNSWIKADSRLDDEIAIAVVREVIDQDRAILQTTGEVPNIDPRVIWPDGSGWEPGRLYQVSSIRGRVELPDPDPLTNDPSAMVHPILMPTKRHAGVDDNVADVGVVLPWRPGLVQRDYRVVGQLKFYYTATAGQTTISGDDLQGNALEYQTGPNTDVFLNGVNLSEIDDYVATDGVSVTFPLPLAEGDHIEIWTPDRPLDVIVQSTAAKMDSIEHLFDGARTDFPLTIDGGTKVAVQSTPNVMAWLDANPQEPFTDYNVAVDTTDDEASLISFTSPPQVGDRFWGLLSIPVGSGKLAVPRWVPNKNWEPGELVVSPDPDFPQRGDNDPNGRRWDIIWANETNAPIPPSPVFDPTVWTPISRARDDDVMYRVKLWQASFEYRRGDLVYREDGTIDAAPRLYRMREDVGTIGVFDADEWERITDVAGIHHDPNVAYRGGEGVVEQDYQRSTFISTYDNPSAVPIPKGAFDPDPATGPWRRVGSQYGQPWGPEFTQTGVLLGGRMTKTGPLQITIDAGSGIVVSKIDPINIASAYVEWPDTVVDLPSINPPEQYWVAFDGTGSVITSVAQPDGAFQRSNILLGTVGFEPTNPTEISDPVSWPVTAQSTGDTVVDIHRNFIPPSFLTGGRLSEGTANPQPHMQVQIETGRVYAYNSNFHNDITNPHEIITPTADPITFNEFDQNGVVNRTAETEFNSAEFDLAGTVTPIPVGEACTHRIFYDIIGDKFSVLLAQRTYASLQEAVLSIPSDDAAVELPEFLISGVLFLGWVSVVQGATESDDTNQVIIRSADGIEFRGVGQIITDLDGLTDVQLAVRRERQRLVFNQTLNVWQNKWDGQETVWAAQPVDPTLADNTPVFFDGAQWVAAQADDPATIAQGWVYNIRTDVDLAPTPVGDIALGGILAWQAHGLTIGATYWLDDAAQDITDIKPVDPFSTQQKILTPLDADNVLLLDATGAAAVGPADRYTSRISEIITQVGHGFTAGQQVHRDAAGTWQLSQANDPVTLKKGTVGLTGVDVFEVIYEGVFNWTHGLNANDTYYLSANNQGEVTTIRPTGLSEFVQPAFLTEGPDDIRVVDQIVLRNATREVL